MSEVAASSNLVPGRFVEYRELELSPGFSDREGATKSHKTPPGKTGIIVEVAVGELPHSFLHALSNATIVLDGLPALRARVVHRNLPEPDSAEFDLSIETPEWVKPGTTYLTITHSQLASVEALPERRAFWVADSSDTLDRLKGFKAEADQSIDLMCARLVASGQRVDQVAHRSRAYFEPSNDFQVPVTHARMSGTAHATVTSAGWDDFDITDLASAADSIEEPRPQDAVIKTPSWWYFQAMQETDPLKRFLYSHWGLEVLAAKFSKAHRDLIVDRIAAEWGLPARSLLWPTPDGSDRPERNVEFTFALMAWAVKGPDAETDIARFRTLAGIRNKLSHGERINHSDLPRHEGYLMLRDYLTLMANYDPAVRPKVDPSASRVV